MDRSYLKKFIAVPAGESVFKRCGNCRYWLWKEDGKWHSLEPKLFRDIGGRVEIGLCHVCDRD